MQDTQTQAHASESPADSHLLVEDVVSTLTGGQTATQGEDIRVHMERAAAEFDKRTADAFGRALLDSLTEDPGNLRQLEALMILGLAHPDVLGRHRISMAVEGRRLAVLLERAGEVERARSVLELLANHLPEERSIDHELAGILRRSGKTDELVDRYLARAQAAVAEGNVKEAIPWLQEILLLDRTRRDVARMIRDLRYQEADRDARASRRNKLVAIVLLISAAFTAIVAREVGVHRAYREIATVDPADPDTLYARLAAVEDFISEKRFWAGFFAATAEANALREQVGHHEREQSAQQESEEREVQRLTEMAEAARMRGLMHSERGDFVRALADFNKSLDLAPAGYPHIARLKADIAALEEWRESQE